MPTTYVVYLLLYKASLSISIYFAMNLLECLILFWSDSRNVLGKGIGKSDVCLVLFWEYVLEYND